MPAPALVQSKTLSGTATGFTLNVPFTTNVTAGNSVFVFVYSPAATISGSVSSITMLNQSVTFGLVTAINDTFTGNVHGQGSLRVGYSTTLLTTSQADSVVVHVSGSGGAVIVTVQEWSNIPAGSLSAFTRPGSTSRSVSASDITGTSTTIDSGAWSTQIGSHIVFSLAVNNGNQPLTNTDGVFGAPVEVNNGTYRLSSSNVVTSTSTTYDATYSMPSGAQWLAELIDFIIVSPATVTQSASNSAASTSVSKQYTSTTTAGNTLFASIYSDGSTPAISGVGTWTLVADNNFDGTQHLTTYYISADGTQPTVMASDASATTMELHIFEINGIVVPQVLDNVPFTYATTSPTTATGNQTYRFSRYDGVLIWNAAIEGGGALGSSGTNSTGTPQVTIDTTHLHSQTSQMKTSLAMGIRNSGSAQFAFTAFANWTGSSMTGMNVIMFDTFALYSDSGAGALGATGAGS
jgi:hypothetical protein